jgi:hypothetical protein
LIILFFIIKLFKKKKKKNLNGHLSKNVYMEQPDGFRVNGK